MPDPLPAQAVRLADCLRFHAARDPDREACVDRSGRTSYGQLAGEVTRWSKALIAAGLTKGDRVAMLAAPSTQWLTVLLATSDIGAIWTGFHPRYQLDEFRHVAALAEPKLVVAPRRLQGRDYGVELMALRTEVGAIQQLVMGDGPLEGATAEADFLTAGQAVDARALDQARAAVAGGDTAVLIFTSGTTGRPKAAQVTHRALLTGAAVQLAQWPMERPRVLHMMPVNHIAGVGMTGIFALHAGGTLVFQDRFDPGELLRLVEAERIDHVLGSPVQFHMMAHHPDLPRRDLSSIRFWTWGGAPMAAELVARIDALPGALRTSFGMTELGLYVTFTDPDATFEVLSRTIGRPYPGFDVRVADEAGRPTPPGGRGEIQARGDWLFAGYFRDPAATAEAYTADGWFRTGDVVTLWPDGNLEIVGRTKEMFISGGFNIYPREVEIVIEAHPATGLVAVLGVPEPVFGEVGHAFVEPKPGETLSVETLKAWCGARLANYKVPKIFELRAELPRLPIGKIDKQALRRELARRSRSD